MEEEERSERRRLTENLGKREGNIIRIEKPDSEVKWQFQSHKIIS